jgi:hypothetical protein
MYRKDDWILRRGGRLMVEEGFKKFMDEIDRATAGAMNSDAAINGYLNMVKAYELRRIANELIDLKNVIREIGQSCFDDFFCEADKEEINKELLKEQLAF